MRGSVKVAPVTNKVIEKWLKWYGHVERMDDGHVLTRMLDEPVPRKKTDNQVERLVCKMASVWLKEVDVLDSTNGKNDILDHSSDPR